MGCVLVATSLALPRLAWAQTCANPGPCVLPPPNPARDLPSGSSEGDARAPQFSPTGINYSDCVANIDLDFALQISNPPAGEELQVWAGPWGNSPTNGPCVFSNTRQSECWPVVRGQVTPETPTTSVSVRAQDVVNQTASATYVAATSSVCKAQATPGATQLGIYFMFLAADGSVDGTAGVYQLPVDTLGPFAPANVTLTIGDGNGTVSWTPPDDATGSIVGYNIYCLNTGDGGSSTGACNGSDFTPLFTVDASLPVATEAGTVATGDDASDSTAFESDVFVFDTGIATVPITPAGISEIPASFQCGTVSGNTASSASITLTNFDHYSFGVAAVDQLGNIGPVGNLTCGTPGPIASFWYDYIKDGGQAGGGYCALEGVGMPAGGACMMLGVGFGAISLARRRRRGGRTRG
jgi:hypothetical protein